MQQPRNCDRKARSMIPTLRRYPSMKPHSRDGNWNRSRHSLVIVNGSEAGPEIIEQLTSSSTLLLALVCTVD